MTLTRLVAGSLALVVSACGTPVVTSGEEPGDGGLEGPPPYRLQYDGQDLTLRPFTWCYANGCADGVPDKNPPSVGTASTVLVMVPIEGWDLTATFTPAGQECGRRQEVTPAKEDGWYVLRPAGRAGAYDVDLFSRGEGEGDMVARFRWTTPTDGDLATPEARLALIADRDGLPDSYGVELELRNLAETPQSVQAQITVTAATGRSLTFAATRDHGECLPEGTVFFNGPDSEGKAAANLGDFPFRFEVTVSMDGRTYRAVAIYPADEIEGNEPSVALRFTPGLPALG